jgi:hypothetical protein
MAESLRIGVLAPMVLRAPRVHYGHRERMVLLLTQGRCALSMSLIGQTIPSTILVFPVPIELPPRFIQLQLPSAALRVVTSTLTQPGSA